MEQHDETKKYTFEELLEEEGCFVYTNVGISMMPLLRQRRDLIKISKKDGQVKKYDVALFKIRDKYILHRCIRVTPTGYIFAGDHNVFKEYDVTDDMVIGIMDGVVRDGKEVNLASFPYRLYSHFVVDFFPAKVFFIRCCQIIHRLKNIVFTKPKDFANWKIVRGVDLINDYRITGKDLTKKTKAISGNVPRYRPPNYLTISKLFQHIELASTDKIIDISCGKGRILAYFILKKLPCQIYGIETNEVFENTCKEWTRKYKNVHVSLCNVFNVDYNKYTHIYMSRSFGMDESYDLIGMLEKQLDHPITLIIPFDQSCEDILDKRDGWELYYREDFLKVHGLKVVSTVKRYSIWTFTPEYSSCKMEKTPLLAEKQTDLE